LNRLRERGLIKQRGRQRTDSTQVLAYNLIRTVMAQAAAGAGVAPRSISFKATLQVLEAFRPLIADRADRGAGHLAALYEQLRRAIAVHRVADRPDQIEPRMTKKAPRGYESLKRPRKEIKLQILKRASKSKCHSSIRPT
jgi:hypothetical protein